MPKAMNAAADTASSIITGKIPMQIPAPAIQAAQRGHPEAIEGYVVAYYYAALTNLFCQICLQPIQQVENERRCRKGGHRRELQRFLHVGQFSRST